LEVDSTKFVFDNNLMSYYIKYIKYTVQKLNYLHL